MKVYVCYRSHPNGMTWGVEEVFSNKKAAQRYCDNYCATYVSYTPSKVYKPKKCLHPKANPPKS